mmetsp:Transcript_55729/g.135033  ORF Transcript_55729/g.135033 Transcript_55729/m.135033 type:complete len:204 (-) Transcript_55729:54-665(-)|eukprot:CAMPEP_0113458250 /NCGR_PEP_ID=MMETSP0014_2-20120614/9826_1 /TAXON_ID=2857 /ORGANISM="Nitzschia sp." /LENGTH=203 /DNA_ID=CAMNT_0000349769 /DNA_START=1046 /DNA_END=1657 /DNA_ORIENTATION=+ /assembly_acc=CAM_ASM_000159
MTTGSLVLIAMCLCTVAVFGNDNGPNRVFVGVQQDDETSIRSAIEDSPSLLDEKGVGGQTPLIHAVLTGKRVAVKTLIELGADTIATEKDGYNILHAVAFQGRAVILRYLLSDDNVKTGLDPLTDQHSDGYYPLHRACWGREGRHTKTVEVFLDHGGVPFDLKAADGRTCIEMTRNQGTIDLITKRMTETVDSSTATTSTEEL